MRHSSHKANVAYGRGPATFQRTQDTASRRTGPSQWSMAQATRALSPEDKLGFRSLLKTMIDN